MPSSFDMWPVKVSHDPVQRIDTAINLPPFDPLAIIEQTIKFFVEYGLDAIRQLTGIDLEGLFAAFQGIDLSSAGAILTSILQLIAEKIGEVVNGLLNGQILVNAANLIGSLAGSLFSFVPIGAIAAQPARTPMVAGTFPDAGSISGGGIWSWDGAVSRTGGSGSAKVTADGTLKAMRGVPIAVSQGQKFEPAIFVEWAGYTGSSAPIQLHVVKFNGDNQVGITTLKTFTPPAASSFGLWAELAGSYLVEENVTSVRVRVVVTGGATAGIFHFDDGGYRMKSNLMSNLTKWLGGSDDDDLFGDPDAFDPTDLIPEPFRDWIGAVLDGLQSPAPKEQPWTDLIGSVLNALGHIPSDNMLGVGGPATMGETQQATWDQMAGGIVGAIGSGSSLSDIWNLMFGVSSNAARGGMSFDILGIRSNKSLDTGFLPTSESPVALSAVEFTSVGDIAITQSASTILFHRFSESGHFGAIGWQGGGNDNLTGFYVNIWKMDVETGGIELVHHSSNIIGDISPTQAPHVYEFTDAEIMREPGDVFGAELTVVGAGTHSVFGGVSRLTDQLVFPRRRAATRNSGTGSPPSTIASGSVAYSPNVSFIEFAVSASSTPIPRQPQTVKFGYTGTSETTVVPSWADSVDLIPGGAGAGGTNSFGFGFGAGGGAGAWNQITLEVGVDIKAGSLITATVGAGGNSGVAGEATTITYIDPSDGVHTITAAGGVVAGVPGHFGQAAGDVTVNGVLYRGGGPAAFSAGADPCGGGGGALSWDVGYRGGNGTALVVSRQS